MTSQLLAGRALDAQVDLLRFTGSDKGQRLALAMAETAPRMDVPGRNYTDLHVRNRNNVEYDDLGHAYWDCQMLVLDRGETFGVSAEIAELLEAAGSTLPDFSLHEDDAPSRTGFVYLERPLHLHDDAQRRPIAVKALGWLPVVTGNELEHPDGSITDREERAGIAIVVWTDPRDPYDHFLHDNPQVDVTTLPPLFFLGIQPHEWNRPLSELGEQQAMMAEVIRWVYALWLFVKEPFIDGRMVLPDRPAQKRALRAGRPTAEVRVIHLRKRETRHCEDAEHLTDDEVLWSHRWRVAGHWRMQWYPSQQRHLPRWINPYIKGPDHLPLLIKDTTYLVDR